VFGGIRYVSAAERREKDRMRASLYTRGHHLRLYKQYVHYDLRKYIFGNRIVSIWNILPDYVITSNSVGIYLRTDLINFGEIKHVILIIQPT